MTIKLITYARAFYPYIWGQKSTIMISVFLVIRDGKLLKRSFAEIDGYTNEGVLYAEIDALVAGISWIIQNVPDINREKLEVVFCGTSRTKIIKGIKNGEWFNDYKRAQVLGMVHQFDDVKYFSQGEIIDDNPIYDLYGFANKIFELYYGRDNGYLHTIYEETGENKKMMIVGEPEVRWKDGYPNTEWS
jgi:hypothetical protein